MYERVSVRGFARTVQLVASVYVSAHCHAETSEFKGTFCNFRCNFAVPLNTFVTPFLFFIVLCLDCESVPYSVFQRTLVCTGLSTCLCFRACEQDCDVTGLGREVGWGGRNISIIAPLLKGSKQDSSELNLRSVFSHHIKMLPVLELLPSQLKVWLSHCPECN